MGERETDVLIVGGGTGGTAAALACARLGVRCVVVESTDWLGGQLTVQAVPPDENQWIEEFGGTRSYQELRRRVRRHYREHEAITAEAAAKERLNPGGGWVSRLCADPRVWHKVIQDWLGELDPRGLVTRLHGYEAAAVEMEGDRVRAVRLRSLAGGAEVVVKAKMVLDATELGDVYPLAGIEHTIGAEHADLHGELHGRRDFPLAQKADWRDQQAISWCFALEHEPGADHVVSRPADYEFWRGYVPNMTPAWTGPLFSWTVPSHSAEGKRTFEMIPWPEEPKAGQWEMWRYRRIVDRGLYRPEAQAAHPDVALINMVQMDYWQKPLLGVSAAEQAAALAGARAQSLALLYWMQTEAPRHDGKGQGYPGLKLSAGTLGTADGFAKAAYIREPRRLIARTIVTEAHVGTEQRRQSGHATLANNWEATRFGTAHRFEDSVGIGHYMIDLHPSCAGRNNVYVPAAPFRVPMGSLIPVRVQNVLAAGKGIGVTHITNGAYRMHHTEWNIGESAAVLAAHCLREALEPQAVHEAVERVHDVQRLLHEQGVRMSWPWEG